MKDYYGPFEEGYFYHVYNRGNNGDNLFYQAKNYTYFLQKYDLYLSDYIETYAYCLLPNHFHLLVRVKTKEEIARDSDSSTKADGQSDGIAEKNVDNGKKVSEQFRRFFIGYSQAIQKQENRTGSLFQKNFKRIKVESDAYFSWLVYYIHANPQTHGITDDFQDYPHSSFGRMMNPKPTKLQKSYVLSWYGSMERYQQFHQQVQDFTVINDLIIEDD
ncbi:MAG: hypothetical protein U0Y10_09085 [Spirosomataceae bacterium]